MRLSLWSLVFFYLDIWVLQKSKNECLIEKTSILPHNQGESNPKTRSFCLLAYHHFVNNAKRCEAQGWFASLQKAQVQTSVSTLKFSIGIAKFDLTALIHWYRIKLFCSTLWHIFLALLYYSTQSWYQVMRSSHILSFKCECDCFQIFSSQLCFVIKISPVWSAQKTFTPWRLMRKTARKI